MQGLNIRPATPRDTQRIAEILAEPGQEAISICGNARLARRFGLGFVRLPGSPQGWRRTTVAEVDGRVAGLIQAGHGAEDFGITPAIALLALRTFGPFRLPGLVRRLRVRGRVHTPPPAGSYHIAELHVDPALRNQGIGACLLDWAEEQARADGRVTMSLSTTTENPARRLYARHGFHIAETRRDEAYARLTGMEGRLLMIKSLD